MVLQSVDNQNKWVKPNLFFINFDHTLPKSMVKMLLFIIGM